MKQNSPSVKKLEIIGACKACKSGKSCLLSGLNAKELTEFEFIINKQFYLAKNTLFVRKGKQVSSIFIVKSGLIKSYRTMNDGKEQINALYQSGDIVGIESIFNGHFSNNLSTLVRTLVCEIPLDLFLTKVGAIKQLGRNLNIALASSLKEHRDLNDLLREKNSDIRLGSFFLHFYEKQKRANVNIFDSMTRNDWSNLSLLRPETVSRVLTRFKEKDLVKINYRKIIIKSPQRLKHCLDNTSIYEDRNHLN